MELSAGCTCVIACLLERALRSITLADGVREAAGLLRIEPPAVFDLDR